MRLDFKDDKIELYDDIGNYIATWGDPRTTIKSDGEHYIKSGAVRNMLAAAFDAGKRARSAQIKNLIYD